MDALAEKCQEMELNTSVMDLTSASRTYALKLGLDSGHLLRLVVKGFIRVYRKIGQPPKVRALFFDRSDIQKNIATSYAENGWVDKTEAIKLLRTSRKTLDRWVNSGLLPMTKYKNCYIFEKKNIEDFFSHYVRSKAAAEILGVDDKDVTVLAQRGFLQAVSGPGIDGYNSHIFSRETLLHWKSTWLTYKEAAKMLEIEETAVFDLAQRGLIRTLKPRCGVKQTGGLRTWYSSQSVLALREQFQSRET
jgi:hypothetical protein